MRRTRVRIFVKSLIGTQGKTTLKHDRAVASDVFSHAVEDQRISTNPWRDVIMPKDDIESADTKHYTMEEAENLVSALVDHVDGQLVLALACFLRLRPAEIAGLQWGDIDEDSIHILRNKFLGEVVTPTTREWMASLRILDFPMCVYLLSSGERRRNARMRHGGSFPIFTILSVV
jgi:integrase